MISRRWCAVGLALAIVLAAISAFAQFPTAMMAPAGSVTKSPASTQTLGTTTLSGTSFTPGAGEGTTVGVASTAMIPTSPAFMGSYSLSSASGGDTTDFSISPSGTLITVTPNLCSSPPCSYTLNVITTQGGISNSPTSTLFTIVSGVPAAANAGCTLYGSSSGSCFATMAVDYDFTGATSCSGSGCAFPGQAANYYQTLSNWLDCQGAATPQWYLSIGNCTPYSIVSDGGAQVLKVSWVAADLSSFDQATIYTAQHNSAGTGTDFPVGFYYEAVVRTDAASDSANSGCACIINDVWSYTGPGNGTPVNEWDFMEQYSTGLDNTGQNMGIPCCLMDGNIFVPPSGYNHEVYNTYGERVTQDGSQGSEVCNYLNGTQISCNLFAQSNGYSFVANPNLSTPLALLMTAGPQFGMPSPVPSVSNMYVKSIKLWTCSGWKGALPPTLNGAACAGGLVATNP